MSDRNIEETDQWKAATWAMSVGTPELVYPQLMNQLASRWPIDNIYGYGESLLCQDLEIPDMIAALSLAHNTLLHMQLQPLAQFTVNNEQVEALSELYGVQLHTDDELGVKRHRRGHFPWSEILKRLWFRRIHLGFPSSHCICLKQGQDGENNKIEVLYVDDIITKSYIDILFIERPPLRLSSV